MALLFKFAALLSSIFLFHSIAAGDYAEEDDVLILTGDNYNNATKEFEHLLVEFYAPWCGHCKTLAPEYAAAAKQLKEEGSDIRLAKVDGSVERDLGLEHKITGFPMLKFYSNQKERRYNGGRTTTTIIEWLKKQTGPPAVILADVAAAQEYIGGKEVSMIGFFPDETTDAAKGFLEAARDAPDESPYAITGSTDVAKEYGITADFGMVVLRTFEGEEPGVVYQGENYTAEAITHFVGVSSLPLIIEYTMETAPRVFDGKTKQQFLYFGSAASDLYKNTHMALMKEIATKYRGKLLFVVFNTDVEENLKVLDVFGLTNETIPAVRIVEVAERDMKKYAPASEDITMENLSPFVEGVADGSIRPTYRTQEIPADWDAKSVKVVVGKNFYDVVINNENNVLLMFHAPWCGHCKSLMSTWDEIGEYFEGRDDYVVAKLDGTANDIEGVDIQGFPTIHLYPGGGKSRPFKYSGQRTFKELLVFAEGGGRSGGTMEAEIPIPKKPDQEPADFEALEEEDIPLEETEEEREIIAEAKETIAREQEAAAREEL